MAEEGSGGGRQRGGESTNIYAVWAFGRGTGRLLGDGGKGYGSLLGNSTQAPCDTSRLGGESHRPPQNCSFAVLSLLASGYYHIVASCMMQWACEEMKPRCGKLGKPKSCDLCVAVLGSRALIATFLGTRPD